MTNKKIFTKESMNIKSVNCCSNCIHYNMNFNHDMYCDCIDELIYVPVFICDEYKNRYEKKNDK